MKSKERGKEENRKGLGKEQGEERKKRGQEQQQQQQQQQQQNQACIVFRELYLLEDQDV